MTESRTDRMLRLGIDGISRYRGESLDLAHPFVDDATFARLAYALRIRRDSKTMLLPLHHFEGLFGRPGWARKETEDGVREGKRVPRGYEVDAGTWGVWASDDHGRAGVTFWDVVEVEVGGSTWTMANLKGGRER